MNNESESNSKIINQTNSEAEVKINHFYITNRNESLPKMAFSLIKGTSVSSYAFSFKIGVIRRNVHRPLTLHLKMKGANNSFAKYPLEGRQLVFNEGWSGTEYSVDNLITNVSPNQTGEYVATIFLDDIKVAEAETTLFIVEED